jgi:hypothetical protein
VTCPVTSASYFSCSSSSWDSQRQSRSFVSWRLDIRSNCSSNSPCDFRLLSLFFFRVRFLSFLFRLCSLLLRLCLFLFLLRLISYADRNYSSSSLYSSSSAMASIAGGAATDDSADPELIVSFGVCFMCPSPAHPHFICRVQEDLIVERAAASEVNCEPDDESLCPVCHGPNNKAARHH